MFRWWIKEIQCLKTDFFAQTFPTNVFSADRKFIGLERTSGNILQELSVTKEK